MLRTGDSFTAANKVGRSLSKRPLSASMGWLASTSAISPSTVTRGLPSMRA